MENDTPQGGDEGLSVDQAAAAYTKAMTKEAPQGQAEAEDQVEGETTDDELQAADEDVSEETDGDTDPEGQPDEETDAEPESDQGRFVASNGKVKLPDGTVSTIAELISGNMKERDYRQKGMATAEEKKAAAAERETAKASREHFEQQATYVTELVKSIVPPPPSPSLADPNSPDYDPAKYQAEDVAHRSWMQHLNYLQTQQDTAAKERQSSTTAEKQAHQQEQWRLAQEKVPVLRDEKRGMGLINDILKFAPTYGYSKDELAGLSSDHRNFVVLEKAIAWDKLQASKPKVQEKVNGKPPVQRGGARQSPDARRARNASDAMNRLKSSGSVEDAAAAYLASRKG